MIEQLFGCSLFRHDAVIDEQHPVGNLFCKTHFMGDDDTGHTGLGQLLDDFQDALAIIERDSYSTSSHVTWWTVAEWNTNATVQANEPLLQYNQNTSHTLWWRWTAREDCKATFRTLGSKDISGNDLDTLMGIYRSAREGRPVELPLKEDFSSVDMTGFFEKNS